MNWSKKEAPTTDQPKEQSMPETKPSQVAIETARLTNALMGVQEEVARFLRKVQEAKDFASTGAAVKLNAPSLISVKRASQDVSYEMKKLRTLLSVAKK